MSDYTTKHCPRCDRYLPASVEVFRLRKNGTYASYCRECQAAYLRQYHEANREKIARQRQEYYAENKDAIIEKVRAYREAFPEQDRSRSRSYYEKHRSERIQKRKEYYASNRDRVLAKRRENIVAEREQRREYERNNKHKRLAYWSRPENVERRKRLSQNYKDKNPDAVRLVREKRRTRKFALPYDFTRRDWEYACNYFHGCCAVCERQLSDLFSTHTAAMDHWIPIASPNCPGTIKSNIIPLCHGKDGCNNSKGASDPVEWLNRKFGKRRAREILKRIQAYFDSLE